LHRKNCDGWIKLPVTKTDNQGLIVEYETTKAMENGGVLNVTDESWKDFNSRDWQKTGKGVLYYASQHRKLGDDWLIVTQNTKQIETALRQVAQDFWVVRNHGKLSIGKFRQPSMFTVAVFEQPPTGMSEPMERRMFRLDKPGLGSCFDTAAGIGIIGGGGADLHERKRGIPWQFFVVAAIALGFGVYKLPRLLGWFVGRSLPKHGQVQKVTTQILPQRTVQRTNESYSTVTNGSETHVEVPVVKVTGYTALRSGAIVYFSDGTTERGSSVQYLSERYCIVNGKKYDMAAPETKIAPPFDAAKYAPKWDVPKPAKDGPAPESTLVIIGKTPKQEQTQPQARQLPYRQ